MTEIMVKQRSLLRLMANKNSDPMVNPSALLGSDEITNEYLCKYIRDMSFYLHQEVVELVEEIGGKDILKPWKEGFKQVASKPPVITDKVRSEAMDVLSFCLNICLAAGITPNNILEEYMKVWNKNIDRQNNSY